MKQKKTFDTNKYKFTELIETMFNVDDLTRINEHYKCDYELFPAPEIGKPSKGDLKGTDQGTLFHKKFYKEVRGSDFLNVMKAFIGACVAPTFNESILYQEIPTFRVQLPNNLSVGGWHKDKEYNHSTDEVNIFLPLTEAKDTNTIWAESEEDKGDYQPMNAKYGEYYIWDGANLKHGNKQNKEKTCRISIDFRVLPLSKYKHDQTKESYGIGKKFALGEYWKLCC